MINTNILYEKNEDFKEYVDRYCKKHNIPVQEALDHYIVKDVAKYYLELK